MSILDQNKVYTGKHLLLVTSTKQKQAKETKILPYNRNMFILEDSL